MNAETEAAHIQLMEDMSHELAVALDSLVGKRAEAVDLYLLWMCKGMCLLSAGYLTLKKEKNDHAARVLVRTAIETALKLAAVYQKPATFYRIAYTEHQEDGKFLNAADENHVITDPAKHAAKWQMNRNSIAAIFPDDELKDEVISAYDLSRIGKMPSLYDFNFRLYCNYTHATLRAHVDSEHIVREADYATLESVIYLALVVAKSRLGADCPNLSGYQGRVQSLAPSAETVKALA